MSATRTLDATLMEVLGLQEDHTLKEWWRRAGSAKDWTAATEKWCDQNSLTTLLEHGYHMLIGQLLPEKLLFRSKIPVDSTYVGS